MHAPLESAPDTDFGHELRDRGIAHERAVKERFAGLVGPIHRRDLTLAECAAETLRLIRESRAPLYQPVFVSSDGRSVGVPDFLYWEDGEPVIRDAKLAENLSGKPEIALQIAHYARLFEDATGLKPRRLEITNGRGEDVEITPWPDAQYRHAVTRASQLIVQQDEPTLLLAHSTCETCRFYEHCWDRAEAERRIEAIAGLNRSMVPKLAALGIHTLDELAARDPEDLRRPGFGAQGPALVHQARAICRRAPSWMAPLALPRAPLKVWFDLEADTNDEQHGTAVYLWGISIDDGAAAPRFEPLLEAGNDEGLWRRFVARASQILDQYPDAPWIHYDTYERTWLANYVKRHGAPAGFLDRLLNAMFDLRSQAVTPTVKLPLRSYSIKRVAPFTGFRWRNPDSGSQWSMVQYRRATQAREPAERDALLAEIAQYNEDDLLAMRSVWTWLEAHAPEREEYRAPAAGAPRRRRSVRHRRRR